MPICFDIERSDRAEVQERLIGRYESKLAEYGIQHDKRRLIEIIDTHYPDLRSIAQKVEFEFAQGKPNPNFGMFFEERKAFND